MDVVKQIMQPGKGILAADESFPTIEKRFKSIDLASTEETRRKYRELLFTTEGMEKYISAVIMFDETIRQGTKDNLFTKVLENRGILPGIKVDRGTVGFANFPGEKFTEGIDGLKQRIIEYSALGAKFAKWRAVFIIGDDIPTKTCMETNCDLLAIYASICQEHDVVPIVEPEVLMDGNHDINICKGVTEAVLRLLFNQLVEHRVILEGTILKPNMILPGTESRNNNSPEDVANATIGVFEDALSDIGGITFLSGGQSPQEATANLNAIVAKDIYSWKLSFSFGRALQDPVLKLWNGDDNNWQAAQEAFLKRAMLNGLASEGKYNPRMEEEK